MRQNSIGFGWQVLPYGEAGLLLEAVTLEEVLALYAVLQVSRPNGVVDVVPAARTLLIIFEPASMTPDRARQWAHDGAERAHAAPTGGAAWAEQFTTPALSIDVRYDGADLADVASQLGMSAAAVIELHTSAVWTAAFTGFAPGFAYLTTEQNGLHVPRRAHARTEVPTGAVGLAGEFSGIYPRASPGGWQLIGSTSAQLWNPASEQPALITPGTRVQFVAVDQ